MKKAVHHASEGTTSSDPLTRKNQYELCFVEGDAELVMVLVSLNRPVLMGIEWQLEYIKYKKFQRLESIWTLYRKIIIIFHL